MQCTSHLVISDIILLDAAVCCLLHVDLRCRLGRCCMVQTEIDGGDVRG